MKRSRAVGVFAVDGFVVSVERLIGLSWPIKIDQFESVARQSGWSSANISGFLTRNLASEEQSITFSEDEVKDIIIVSFPPPKPEREGVEKTKLVSDTFIAYTVAGIEAWRKLFRTVVGKYSRVA